MARARKNTPRDRHEFKSTQYSPCPCQSVVCQQREESAAGRGLGLILETIDLETWEDFQEKIAALKPPKAGGYLFRGQGNASWLLETTLERSGQKNILFSKYYRIISVIRSQIESFTS